MSAGLVINRRVDCKGLIGDLFNLAAFPHSWHKFLAALAIGNPGCEIVGRWRSGNQTAGLDIKFPHARPQGFLLHTNPSSITLRSSSSMDAGFTHAQLELHQHSATSEQWQDLRRLVELYSKDLIRALDFSALCYENSLGQAFMRAVLDAMSRPAFIVASDCLLLFSNDEGDAELSKRDLLVRGSDQRLRLSNVAETSRFQMMIKEVAATKNSSKRLNIKQQREQGKFTILEASALRSPNLSGLSSELPAIALVTLRRPDGGTIFSTDMLVAGLGLTPTEARLASALAQGQSVAEFASAADIKLTTARWHLRNIMSRLECRTQTDLVRLVLSVCA